MNRVSVVLRAFACLMVCVLIASGLKAYAQNSYVQSTGVGGGILYWTNNASGPNECGNDYTYYSYRYSTFSWVAAGVTYPLNGVDAYIATPNGVSGCPPSGPEPGPYITMALPVSYGAGNCVISFYPGNDTGTATIECSGIPGYVDPKFIVVGVTYAPPGPSSNTWVSYANSSLVGNTTTTANSFTSSTAFSVSLKFSAQIPAVAKGSFTAAYSTTNSQTNKSTNTVTTSVQVQSGEKTAGTGSYFAPVDHDYDILWVWLNPVDLFTLGSNKVVWNGYGYDATDQNGMDIVGIELGYLNGDFGTMPPQYASSIARTWAASQTFAAGAVPGLTSADLAQIASADPFSVSTYGTDYITSNPPSPQTADYRFTESLCSTQNSESFGYDQAAPSQAANIFTCTLAYTNTSTQAQEISSTASQTFSVDASFSESAFVVSLTADLKSSSTLSQTTDWQNSITKTTTSTASLSVQGPACNNVQPEVGPCVPVYDAGYNEPTEFYVYQDNMYGTFMFAPVDYY